MKQLKNPLVIVFGLSFIFFVMFLSYVNFYLRKNGDSSSLATNKKMFGSSGSYVGVIEINGVIMDSKKILEQIDDFSEEKAVKGVVIRINSPGGAVAPSQEIYEALKKLSEQKPTYASLGNVAASGGYYVACGTKKIISNPGTITASIGVIMQFMDLSKLFQWAKVNPYNIRTGKFKDIGSPNREMTTEEKELLLNMANNVLGQFRKAVATARSMSMEDVVAISDGRIMSGEQAKEAKLVDELGGINDAIEAVAKEAGIEGKPKVVYPSKKKNFLEMVLDADDEANSESRFQSLLHIIGNLLGNSRVGAVATTESAITQSQNFGPMYLATYLAQ